MLRCSSTTQFPFKIPSNHFTLPPSSKLHPRSCLPQCTSRSWRPSKLPSCSQVFTRCRLLSLPHWMCSSSSNNRCRLRWLTTNSNKCGSCKCPLSKAMLLQLCSINTRSPPWLSCPPLRHSQRLVSHRPLQQLLCYPPSQSLSQSSLQKLRRPQSSLRHQPLRKLLWS